MQVTLNGSVYDFTFLDLSGNELTQDSAKHRFNPWILNPEYEALALRSLALYLSGDEVLHRIVWWEYSSGGYFEHYLLYAYLVRNSVRIRTSVLKRLWSSHYTETYPILTTGSFANTLSTTLERQGLPLIEFKAWGEQPSIQEYLDALRTTRLRNDHDSLS